MLEIAEKLLYFRKSLRFNQTEIAKKVGVSQRTWSNYELGIREPPRNILIELEKMGFDYKNPTTQIDQNEDGQYFNVPETGTQYSESLVKNFEKVNCFEIPLLTKEQATAYKPKTEIPEPQAHNGEYPNTILTPIPYWLKEYSTDLRAITIFNSRMAPVLNAGDIAIFEATGFMGNGIYVHRFQGKLCIGHIHWENNKFLLWTEFEPNKIETDEIDPVGRIRATIKQI